MSEVDLSTTSDIQDQLQLIHSPNLCLPTQSVMTMTWCSGWKDIAGLSLSFSLGRKPRSGQFKAWIACTTLKCWFHSKPLDHSPWGHTACSYRGKSLDFCLPGLWRWSTELVLLAARKSHQVAAEGDLGIVGVREEGEEGRLRWK